eukprot:scpid41080/ scgid33642/ Double-strand-break repair protein rad21 homolog; Nuclear matrix protein 1; SCC1 homolog
MFFADPLLIKKGKFSHIWLAAHWEKKLTKAHIVETDIGDTVKSLLEEPVKLALRTSGHLLLGVVRIYARKAKYLLTDCNEVHVKIKVAFRPGMIDMPGDAQTGKEVTLPDTFFAVDMGPTDLGAINWETHFARNQARDEDITLRDVSMPSQERMLDRVGADPDDFGALTAEQQKQFFQDSTLKVSFDMDVTLNTTDNLHPAVADDDGFGAGPGRAGFDLAVQAAEEDQLMPPPDDDMMLPMDVDMPPVEDALATAAATTVGEMDTTMDAGGAGEVTNDMTTMIQPPEHGFVLEPLAGATLKRSRGLKRKRALLVNDSTMLSNDQMRTNLADTATILQQFEMAPRSKRALRWAQHNDAESLMVRPAALPAVSADCLSFFRRLCRRGNAGDMNTTVSFDLGEDTTLDNIERARAAQSRSDMDADLGGADISTTTTSFAGRSTTIDGLGEISAELNAIPPPEEDDFLMPPQQDEFMPPVDQPDEFIPPVEEEAAEEGVEVTASGRPVHWTATTANVLKTIRRESSKSKQEKVSFDKIVSSTKTGRKVNRMDAARTFLSVLLLARDRAVSIAQEEPLAPVMVGIRND